MVEETANYFRLEEGSPEIMLAVRDVWKELFHPLMCCDINSSTPRAMQGSYSEMMTLPEPTKRKKWFYCELLVLIDH